MKSKDLLARSIRFVLAASLFTESATEFPLHYDEDSHWIPPAASSLRTHA